MEGFVVFDYAPEFPSARAELSQWLSEGKIQRKETIIKGGLREAEQALCDLYKGVNTGESFPRPPPLLAAQGSLARRGLRNLFFRSREITA